MMMNKLKRNTKMNISTMKTVVNIVQLVMVLTPILLSSTSSAALALLDNDANTLSRVPPMGWNPWNAYYCDVTEDAMKEAADQLIRLKLKDVGYTYVNIDDCWMSYDRHNETGEYQANPQTFPSGIPHLAQYLHDRGFKFGLYTSAGTKTCAGFPGSLYHEELDAKTFANWQVDYLKYDNCYNDNIPSIIRYVNMRNALLQTGRPIFYSLCQWGLDRSWQWAPSVAHVWRTTQDISPEWNAIINNFWENQQHIELIGRFTHAWADPDLLEIGNGNTLTVTEEKTHFGLWVMAKAPLMLSTKLTQLSTEVLNIISNTRLIGIHQNAAYPPARCYVGCRGVDYSNSTMYSILATSNVFFNLSSSSSSSKKVEEPSTSDITVAIVVNWSNHQTLFNMTMFAHDVGVVPLPGHTLEVTDLWTGQVVVSNLKPDHNGLIPILIPVLRPHDNVIYQLVIHKPKGGKRISSPTKTKPTTILDKQQNRLGRDDRLVVAEPANLAESLSTSSWRH